MKKKNSILFVFYIPQFHSYFYWVPSFYKSKMKIDHFKIIALVDKKYKVLQNLSHTKVYKLTVILKKRSFHLINYL